MGWGMQGDTRMTVMLPPTTEEWAEELVESIDMVESVKRRDDGLVVTAIVGGNCNAASNLQSLLSELEDALGEGQIDPFEIACVARKEKV